MNQSDELPVVFSTITCAQGMIAGVARSRSDALAWCVRLVGEHADEWLGKLREAMAEVDDLRAEGPGL